MAYPPGRSISGGSGAIVIRNEHIFADTSARDTYFASHTDELTNLLYIYIKDLETLQQYYEDSTSWISVQPVVGIQGDPGPFPIIHELDEKVTPVDADVIVIEDSNDSWATKKVAMSNLIADSSWGSISGTITDQTDLETAFNSVFIRDQIIGSGIRNVRLGKSSLYYNTTGVSNTAIGYESLTKNRGGSYNTAVGQQSLIHINSNDANNNTAIGTYALSSLINGWNNTALGTSAGNHASQKTNVINSTMIGSGSYTTKDNQVVIGNTSIVETLIRGNVRIANDFNSPIYKLEIDGMISIENGDNPPFIIDALSTKVVNLNSEYWDGQALPSIAEATGLDVLRLNSDKSALEFATGEFLSNKGIANGYAPLDAATKIPSTYLPAISITSVIVDETEPASPSEGMVWIKPSTGTSKIYDEDSTTWYEIANPTGYVTTVNGESGPTVSLDYSDIGAAAATHGNQHITSDMIPIAVANTSPGLLSGMDKAKLDGIAESANNYSLPTASAEVLGGIKVGANLSIAEGVLSAEPGGVTEFIQLSDTPGSYGLENVGKFVRVNAVHDGLEFASVPLDYMFKASPSDSTPGYLRGKLIEGDNITITLNPDVGSGETITIAASGDAFPDQSGNAGKYLSTDGTDVSWTAVDALPSQDGNAGKFLTTDGTDASWMELPSTTFASGDAVVTLPENPSAGQVYQYVGTGVAWTINANTGQTIRSLGDTGNQLTSGHNYASVALICIGTDEWSIYSSYGTIDLVTV